MLTAPSTKYLFTLFQFLNGIVLGLVLSQIVSRSWTGETCAKAAAAGTWLSPSSEHIDSENYFLVIIVMTSPRNLEYRNTMRETCLHVKPRKIEKSDFQNNIFIPNVKENMFLEFESIVDQKRQLKTYLELLEKTKIPNIKVSDLKIKHVFAIATLDLDPKILSELNSEQRLHNDLYLIEDIKDSHTNLTLMLRKSIQKMERTTPNFKYLLKSDDQVYLQLGLLTEDLIQYDKKLQAMQRKKETNENLQLYWGYFSGQTFIERKGKWEENDYTLCCRYLPFASGSYILSKGLISYIAKHAEKLNHYRNDAAAIGTWLSPFRNIHRRHDLRFDVAHVPKNCKPLGHFVFHQNAFEDFTVFKGGIDCQKLISSQILKHPNQYFYDWKISPINCCNNKSDIKV